MTRYIVNGLYSGPTSQPGDHLETISVPEGTKTEKFFKEFHVSWKMFVAD